MKLIIAGSLFFIFLFANVKSMTLTPLYGYAHSQYGVHYYTLNSSVIGYGVPAGLVGLHSYRSEGITCLMETEELGLPLHHYFKQGENLYTTNTTEVDSSYIYKGKAGYCYSTQETHTVPLYRYKKTIQGILDHYYTTDPNKIGLVTPGTTGNNGYTYEGVACFVYNVKYHT